MIRRRIAYPRKDRRPAGNMTRYLNRPIVCKVDGDTGEFSGMASVFGNVDAYRDTVEPGAFADSLAEHKRKGRSPKMLWHHDRYELPVGIWTKLEETDEGLHVEGQLALEVQRGAEIYSLMKLGAIDALSIGYRVPVGGATYDSDSNIQTLHKITLVEISPVNFPADDHARIDQVRDALRHGEHITKGDLDQYLRDVGLPSRMAAKLIAGGFSALSDDRRDDDPGEALRALSELADELDRIAA